MLILSKSICIIDDSVDIQNLLKTLLESEGYLVTSAFNGMEGLKLIESSEALPDLILLDIMMPIMDGATFLDEIQKRQQFEKIKILVMSADNKVSQKFPQLKQYHFINKPFELEALLEAIQSEIC